MKKQVAWLNLTGSGNETSAHIQNFPRMTLRLYGNASVIHKNDNQWAELYKLFDDYIGARQIFLMDIEMVQTSCGMAVPLYEFKGGRGQLIDSFKRRGQERTKAYWKQKNQISIDGKETNILTKNT